MHFEYRNLPFNNISQKKLRYSSIYEFVVELRSFRLSSEMLLQSLVTKQVLCEQLGLKRFLASSALTPQSNWRLWKCLQQRKTPGRPRACLTQTHAGYLNGGGVCSWLRRTQEETAGILGSCNEEQTKSLWQEERSCLVRLRATEKYTQILHKPCWLSSFWKAFCLMTVYNTSGGHSR